MSASPPAIRTCTLTPENAATPAMLYDCLAGDLALPRHFGRNLDALYDCLTTDVRGPFAIVVRQPGALRDLLGDTWDEFAVLLLDLVTERDDLTVTFTGD